MQWHLAKIHPTMKLHPWSSSSQLFPTALAVIKVTENCLEITIILQQTPTDDSYPDPAVSDKMMLLKSVTFCIHVALSCLQGFSLGVTLPWEKPLKAPDLKKKKSKATHTL